MKPLIPIIVTAGLALAPFSVQSLIILPSEEKVANVFAGDTVDWVFDGGHVASRFISIKPKVANGDRKSTRLNSSHRR